MSVDEWLGYNYLPPIHSMDSAFEDHDYVYDKYKGSSFFSDEILAADKVLVQKLRELGPDPRKWPDPPKTEDGIASAIKFYAYALDYFEGKEAVAYLLKKHGSVSVAIDYPIVFPFYRQKTILLIEALSYEIR